ncbi:hypothetical protein DPMN_104185 [Dreissena polymorpha]|uniref:Uncharacterized protein n=1 Tax=Dreissena polymorpha TaxID=45954 RepID=A0A9D4K2X7_DREPO|nr:hypothetical protein DPMN_104185 [Dreissena polymorpha]
MYSGDKSCILSTLDFVCNLVMKHNLPTIVTFDKPLYWKAAIIIIEAPQTEELFSFLLRGETTLADASGSEIFIKLETATEKKKSELAHTSKTCQVSLND